MKIGEDTDVALGHNRISRFLKESCRQKLEKYAD